MDIKIEEVIQDKFLEMNKDKIPPVISKTKTEIIEELKRRQTELIKYLDENDIPIISLNINDNKNKKKHKRINKTKGENK